MQDTVKELQTQIEALQNMTSDVAFSAVMDEAELNRYLEATEMALNGLYDKSRLLGNLHDEVQEWAIKGIEQTEELLHDTLYNLEQNMQEMLTSGSTLIILPKNSATVCRLSDGTELPQCLITKNGIMSPFNIVKTATISSVYVERDYTPVRSTMELAAEQAGRVYYKTSQPQEITETLMLRLTEDFNGNYISCNPVNADIVSMKAVDENGETIDLAYRDGFFSPQKIREFRIKLKAKNYLRITSTAITEPTEDALLSLSTSQRTEGEIKSSEEEAAASLEDERTTATADQNLAAYDNYESTLAAVTNRNNYLSDLGGKTIEEPTAINEETETVYEDYYYYAFGTDQIDLQKVAATAKSAVVFPVTIGNCNYIELAAEYKGNGFTASIIDGGSETIIAPGEKYSPNNESISLKVLLEQTDGQLPTIISKLAIKKYGGDALWQ